MTIPNQDREKCRYCGRPGNKQHCYQKEWRKNNPTLGAIAQRQYRDHWNPILRQQIFDYYGSKCACCGETEPLFLTIDHVNEDGWKERQRNSKGNYSTGTLDRLKKIISNMKENPEKYQILCMNCNTGKHRNKGTCPHKR